MRGIKAVLALGLLLTAAEARPEGYGGVKGGRNHKSTGIANAFASAEATAHGDGGYLGTPQSLASASAQSSASASAQSSASASAQSSASATANAFAIGGASNAAATANAYADGGNIGKVIGSDDANGNANPLGDSDDLRLSSVHAEDSGNQSGDQEGGTYVGSDHNANTGSYGDSGSGGVTGHSEDRRPGCVVPAGVKGHRGASGCRDGNVAEENKPSVPNPYPAYNGNPGLSGGSKYPMSQDGGHGGNNAGAQPCTSGASGCPKNKPSVSNPYPAYNGNPDLSGGSKYPMSQDGGYGGNNAGTQPCTSGASGCPKNKPSVSNPYPAYNGNPDLSGGSKYPVSQYGGYGGNNAGAQPCTSGASGCPKNKPSVSNPYPAYNGNPDLSGGSKYPMSQDGGYGGNNAGTQPCTSGASGCPKNKPSVSNPYPAYNGNPDLSGGSKYPMSQDGGYEGIAKPQPPSCSGGAPGCSGNKPSVSNPHAVYPGYADSSPDSQHSVDLNHGQVGGHTGKPQDTPCFPGDPRCLAGSKPKPTTPDPSTTGIIESGPIPCTPGSVNCPNTNPGVANPHPTHHENPDLSGGSTYPSNLNSGHGGQTPATGEHPSSGSPHYPGSSRKPDTSNPFLNGEIDVSDIKDSVNAGGASGIKTNPANPFLNPHSQVRPTTCTNRPEKPNGSYGSSIGSDYPHGGSPGDSALPTIKPNPSNPFLSHNGHVDSTYGINHPGASSGNPQNTNSPTGQGHPAANGGCHGSTGCGSSEPGHPTGSSEYPVNKPNPSNPFLSHNGHVDSTYGINHPGVSSGNPQNTNSPTGQGHPATNGGCHGSTGCGSNEPGHPTGSSEYPVNKPNPANPFLSHNGHVDSPNHVQNTNSPTGQGHPAANGGCHGSTGCGSSEPGHPTGSSEYPVNKPNPSNPFLSHNGPVDSTYGINHPGASSGNPQNTNSPTGQGHPAANGGCHGSTGCGSSEPGHPTGSSEYPVNKPNPSNPFLPHNGEAEKTTGTKYPDLKPPVLKNPGSFGESSYDRIDPHSSVNKNHGSQDLPSVYPGKEPTGSNPYSDDGQLTNPHPKPGSHETPDTPRPLPGHNNAESHSTSQYHGNGNAYGTEDQGVKTRQPGVKGGSRRREPSANLQESELLSGGTGSAYSTAHASASASAHSSAYASSSSYSEGGHSSAKSDAYSDLGSSGSSNSWASSSASASASASAFASSSSHQGSENWQFPHVPAE